MERQLFECCVQNQRWICRGGSHLSCRNRQDSEGPSYLCILFLRDFSLQEVEPIPTRQMWIKLYSPASPPDLTPLDFGLWRWLNIGKTIVNRNHVHKKVFLFNDRYISIPILSPAIFSFPTDSSCIFELTTLRPYLSERFPQKVELNIIPKKTI